MKFDESIDAYVRHKNAMGVEFDTGKKYLIALAQRVGTLELDRVDAKHVAAFLDASEVQAATWRMKYYVLLNFFDFWAARNEIPYLSFPPIKPRVRNSFVPYIFSRSEVRALVRIPSGKIETNLDPITMRTFLLFLYATGAMAGEAWNLSVHDIDMKNRMVTIKNRCITRSRKIPMSNDLCEVLRKYFAWRLKKKVEVSKLFVNKNGTPAGYESFLRCFRKRCEFCNIRRERSSTYQPRLHDLKFTFAVHRIRFWIRSKTDLNKMLPALAAYMGLKLVTTERYFYLTPERFTKHLNKLSPPRTKNHWRNNPDLMKFLNSL